MAIKKIKIGNTEHELQTTIANVTNLQSSLDAKQATVTGAATTITGSNLTANRALVSNSSGKVAVSAVTSTELGYLDGVTSNVQTQLDGKSSTSHTHNLSTMINTLTEGTAVPTDADYYVCQSVGGGTTTTTYHRRPLSALWTWIKSKADSVYQAKGSYETAGAANSALSSAKSYTDSKVSAINYAGSSSAGGAATSANKLNTNAGSLTVPVYFSSGVPVACSSLSLNTSGTAAKLASTNLTGSTTNTSGYWNPFTWTVTSAYGGVSGIYTIHDHENNFNGIFSLKIRTGNSASTHGYGEVKWLSASVTPPTLTITYVSDTTNVNTIYRLYITIPGIYRTYYIGKITEKVTSATAATSTAITTSITGTTSSTASQVQIGGATVGSSTTPMYLKAGVPTACSNIATTSHTHTVSHTPAGTVSKPTFTGSAVTSGAPSATATVASSTHTHKYTPAGTVSKPTFTGSAVTSGAPSGTTSVYSITGVGSVPSLSASVTNRCLTLTFSAGSVPTRSSVTVASSAHTHSVTASGAVSQPTFTGTEASTTSITGTASVAGSAHTHSVTASGAVSQPTFTGTAATLTTSSAK